jgi:hypothetical protein
VPHFSRLLREVGTFVSTSSQKTAEETMGRPIKFMSQTWATRQFTSASAAPTSRSLPATATPRDTLPTATPGS